MPFADFSPDFTLNSQIWLFYAEKWIFLKKKLGTLLNVITQHKNQKWNLPVDNIFPFYSRGIKLWSNKKNQVGCLRLIYSKTKNVEPDH